MGIETALKQTPLFEVYKNTEQKLSILVAGLCRFNLLAF